MMNSRVRSTPARGRGLVALLDLEVVEDQRQVAVGAHDLRDVEGDRLLVGHREHELRALAVGELEQLFDLQPPGLAPQLGRLQHRHQHLLPADRVHLLADDRLDALVHAPAGGQPRPHAGAHLAHQAGAHHQLVRDRLGVGGGLLLGRAGGIRRGGSSVQSGRAGGASHERIRPRSATSAQAVCAVRATPRATSLPHAGEQDRGRAAVRGGCPG